MSCHPSDIRKDGKKMAIDSKISMMNQMEKRLGAEITADTMTKVMRIMADVIEGFDIREIRKEEEVDDLLE